MSEQEKLQVGGMTFVHHGEKGWWCESSGEWCSEDENGFLYEILQRDNQLTALREKNERLESLLAGGR